MNDKLIYILSVGLAFYGGMKLTKSKVVTKEVIKHVIVNEGPTISYVTMQHELAACKEKYDELVVNANRDIEKLQSTIDSCEEKYYQTDLPEEKENLYPEEVTEKEPTNGKY